MLMLPRIASELNNDVIKHYQRRFLFRDYSKNVACKEMLYRFIKGCYSISNRYNLDIKIIREDIFYPHGHGDQWVGYLLSFFYNDPTGEVEPLFEDVMILLHA